MVDYTLLHSTTSFLPATASVAAGAALVDGWVDIAGGAYGTDSGGVLRRIADDSSSYLKWQLLRPTAENTQDGKAIFSADATKYQRFYVIFRSNRADDATATAYAVGVELSSSGLPYMGAYTLVNGATTWIGDATDTFGTTSYQGVPFTCEVEWTQTDSATTTITLTMTDSSGNVVGTHTLTDTTAALQNVTGSIGVACYSYKGGANSSTNEAGLTAFSGYTAAAVTAPFSTYTLTGPATLTVGTASTFTITPGAGAALTADAVFTLTTTLTGTLSAQKVTIPAGSTSPVTFTLAPSASGTGTLSVTNNASLTDPAALSLTAGTEAQNPTTLTPTVDKSSVLIGGSVVVTYSLDHPATSAETITGWTNGKGSYSPATATIAVGQTSAQLTFTPSGTGSTMVGATLSDTSISAKSTSIAVTQNTTLVPITDKSILFSPSGWTGDTGRGGSVYRKSIWNGAWFEFTWTASAVSPSAVLKMGNASAPNSLNIFVNGAPQLRQIANADITLSNIIPGGQNTAKVFLAYTDPTVLGWAVTARYAAGSVGNVQLPSIQIDSASTPGTARALRPYVVYFGDSITEGVHANNVVDQASNYYGDNGCCHSFMFLQGLDELGYDLCIKAAGGIGFLYGPGDGGVPAFNTSWDMLDSANSVLDSDGHWSGYGDTNTMPTAFILNMGYNDATHYNSTQFQAAIQAAITNLRGSAPDAWIIVTIPFSMRDHNSSQTALIPVYQAAVTAYQAANPTDTKVQLWDFGEDIARLVNLGVGTMEAADKDHPTLRAHSMIAPRFTAKFAALVGGWGAAPTPTPTPSTNERVYTFS
ncbi:hypothetical protein AA0472_1132 [Acetobacter estunensis NRIC 0472]|uniref:Uncharacterized protein n=1 Tax=Acetobacter estunensis TaxID=104097 RepID=A0A967ECI5_9PROT|nr:SGNH/GDSL hydrolase family protein [Acetobacter estunensis]NHO53301.1 hypothetical protein [Acetobacter estunensis]GBQ23536.1 hypothetical protein AA0472_1132 [Acetobacter estunensis NRIC 0472]